MKSNFVECYFCLCVGCIVMEQAVIDLCDIPYWCQFYSAESKARSSLAADVHALVSPHLLVSTWRWRHLPARFTSRVIGARRRSTNRHNSRRLSLNASDQRMVRVWEPVFTDSAVIPNLQRSSYPTKIPIKFTLTMYRRKLFSRFSMRHSCLSLTWCAVWPQERVNTNYLVMNVSIRVLKRCIRLSKCYIKTTNDWHF